MSVLLRAENLSYACAGSNLLDRVSFSLSAGEYLSVVGPNGSGKTTLLKIISRIVSPYQGSLILGDRELRRIPIQELAGFIGYVPQLFSAEFPLSVFEFVMMGLYAQLGRFSRIADEQHRQVQAALSLTGTEKLSRRIMQTLSGGERQRVLIAAALVHNPQILLLDEPTTFLDPKHEFEVEELLKEIRRELGVSIIAVTHNLNLCALSSDAVLALRAGRVVFTGAPRDFMQVNVLFGIFDHRFDLLLHPRRDLNIIVPRAE